MKAFSQYHLPISDHLNIEQAPCTTKIARQRFWLLQVVRLMLALLSIPHPAHSQIPNGSQAGADVTVGNNWILGGEYANINRFIVPAGVTLTVRTYDGTANSGNLLIRANYIEIHGTIKADGAGHGGGGGAGGGGGGNQAAESSPGISGFGAGAATRGIVGCDCGNGGNGAFGGRAAGPYRGSIGHPGTGATKVPDDDQNGTVDAGHGGYRQSGTNGDTSSHFDDGVDMGSGGSGGGSGGGGGGGNLPGVPGDEGGGAGGGGGGGGNGGGIVRLIAQYSLVIGPSGSVTSMGLFGGDGYPGQSGRSGSPGAGGIGGTGGSFNSGYANRMNGLGGAGGAGLGGSGPGGKGSNGGSGAGGGILLKAPILDLQGTINNASRLGTNNGGTVKLFPGIDGLLNLKPLVTGRRSGTNLSFALNAPIISPLNPPPSASTSITVSISDNDPGVPNVIIRYTINGAEPTPQSPQYTGPFSVSSTSVIRARAFARGWDWTISPTATSTVGICQPVASSGPPQLTGAIGGSVTQGMTVQLCIAATGTAPFSYQWRKDGQPKPGATSTCLTLANIQAEDAGCYSVAVSNACGFAVSSATCVTVLPRTGTISGYVWDDYNTNGVRDDIITGDRPDVIFVMDVSGSTGDPFIGSPVGDPNGDGLSNTVLDAEIFAFGRLNQLLINQQFGQIGRVTVVSFSSGAAVRDMSPANGNQTFVSPATDTDLDSVYDVDEVLRAERLGNGTNYREALGAALALAQSLSISNTGSLIFLSDGIPNQGGDFTAEVSALRNRGINLRAFGVGQGASLAELLKIDPRAQVFTNTDELIGVFSGLQNGNGAEPFFPGVTVYLDENNNQQLDGNEQSMLSGTNGRYGFTNVVFGNVSVRQVLPLGYYEVAPGAGGAHSVTVNESTPNAVLNFGIKATDRFSLPKVQGNAWELTYAADLAKRFQIQTSLDLRTWTPLTNIIGTNYPVVIHQPRDPSVQQGYFRAVAIPPATP